jgi:hypothetical protein
MAAPNKDTFSPVTAEQIFTEDPRYNALGIQTPGPTHVVDDGPENIAEIQRRMEEGLFSSDARNAIRPASRGEGRGRDR